MPSSPEVRKEYYRRNKQRWKNPDGSWRKANTDSRANGNKHYHTNKDTILAKRRAKTQIEREARTANCPICNIYDVLVYDHDHETGLFRDYICFSCNLALGHAKDNPETLRKMAEYLECKKNSETATTLIRLL